MGENTADATRQGSADPGPTARPSTGRRRALLAVILVAGVVGAAVVNRPRLIALLKSPSSNMTGQDAPAPLTLHPGDVVLIGGPRAVIADDVGTLEAYEIAQFDEDREATRSILGSGRAIQAAMGDRVEVVAVDGKAIKVRVLPGSRQEGRVGYVRSSLLAEIPPADEDVPAPLASIPLETRQALYAELTSKNFQAVAEVDRTLPELTSGPQAQVIDRDRERRAIIDEAARKARSAAMEAHGLSEAQVELLLNEGYLKSWPRTVATASN